MKSRVNMCVLLVGFCLLLAGGLQADSDDTALRLRAAFVLNFLKFAEWPEQDTQVPDAPLIFAVVGSNGITSVLKNTFEGRMVEGRRIEVHSVRNATALAADTVQYHALFVEISSHADWKGVQNAVRKKPVLTIAEMPGFCLEGGMLNLVQVGDRIRFEANPDAARESGVKLRAELLSLATIVDSRKDTGR